MRTHVVVTQSLEGDPWPVVERFLRSPELWIPPPARPLQSRRTLVSTARLGPFLHAVRLEVGAPWNLQDAAVQTGRLVPLRRRGPPRPHPRAARLRRPPDAASRRTRAVPVADRLVRAARRGRRGGPRPRPAPPQRQRHRRGAARRHRCTPVFARQRGGPRMSVDAAPPRPAHELVESLRQPTRDLRKAIPDTWKGFATLHHSAVADGALPAKVKELMALAIAVVEGCEGCIAYHASGAARQGATEEEVAEALGVAVLMRGGPASVYGPIALETFREFAEPTRHLGSSAPERSRRVNDADQHGRSHLRGLPVQRGAPSVVGRGPPTGARRGGPGRSRAVPHPAPRPRQAAAARPRRGPAGPGHAVPGAVAAGAARDVRRGRARRRASSRGSGRSAARRASSSPTTPPSRAAPTTR